MNTLTLEQVIARRPDGCTHIHYNGECGYSYLLILKENQHRYWLGRKHGGWSFALEYKYPRFSELISVKGLH